jgi:hypothetical protein
MGAVDIHPMAVDNSWQCRPHDIPAKRYITGSAGDAVGILRWSSGKTNAVVFSAVQPHRLGVLIAASNAFVAEEQGLGTCGPTEMVQASKTASTHILPRLTGFSKNDRGSNLLTTPPQPVSLRRIGGGVGAERK